MRGHIWRRCGAFILLLVLTGCGEATATPALNATPTSKPPTATPVTQPATVIPPTATSAPTNTPKLSYSGQLVWWQPDYQPNGATPSSKAADAAAAAFSAHFPGVSVTIIGYDNDATGLASLNAAVSAHTEIDVFRAPANQVINMADRDLLAPIDDVLTDADRADFYPNILARLTYKGHIYGWPLWVSPTVIYLNKDIFAAKNVALPDSEWTYEQFVAAAKKLTATPPNGTPVYGYSTAIDTTQPALWSFIYGDDGHIFDPKTGKFDLDTPNAVKGLTKEMELAQLYKITPPQYGKQSAADIRAAFGQTHTLAMYAGPATDAADFGSDLNFLTLPVPVGANGKHSLAGSIDVYAVPHNDKDDARQRAAMALAHFLTGTDVANVSGYYVAPPARRSVTVSPPFDAFTALVPYTDVLPLVPQWPSIAAQLQPHIRNAILGYETADEALSTASTGIAPMLAPPSTTTPTPK